MKKKGYKFEFAYTPNKINFIRITNLKTGKLVELKRSDYSIKGNTLTLKKDPKDFI